MIGRLNHVAIAVPSLIEGVKTYSDILGAKISQVQELPEHGVKVIFIELPNTKIELLEAMGDESPIAAFIERNPAGGIHHICYEVEDIIAARDKLTQTGARVLGAKDGNVPEPKIGAHGNPVLFLHPKDFQGTLIELEEVKATH